MKKQNDAINMILTMIGEEILDDNFSGNHSGDNNATVLTDSTVSWSTDEYMGYTIQNITDGSEGVVTANTANTITATLAGGLDNDWDTADAYVVYAPQDTYEVDVINAVLEETKKELLSEGLDSNTDYEWDLIPDADDYIAIPVNALRVSSSEGYRYIAKDGKLYDKEKKTYKFENVDSVKVDIIWDEDFDDLPYAIQYYIVARAGRKVYQRLVGKDNLNVMLQDELEAKEKMLTGEADTASYSIFDSPTVARAITRSSNPNPVGN